jgi:photosystem II stability/assembly factor-like uncharacterized protein
MIISMKNRLNYNFKIGVIAVKETHKFMLSALVVMLLVVMVGCKGQVTDISAGDNGTVTSAPPTSIQPPASAIPTITPSPSSSDNQSSIPSVPIGAPTGKVTAVRLADPQSGWIGGEGWIARTDDGGGKWQMQYIGKGTVHQLFALNNQQAWASFTESSNLLSTTDGGTHWATAGRIPNKGFLHFVSANEAFSANARTTDGGKSWSTLPVPANTVGDVYFHDKNRGWAVTQFANTLEVKRTLDGGQTWQIVMTRKLDSSINGALIRSTGTDDAWIECIGDSGMTQTSYSLFHTKDGGKQWQTVIANSTAGGGPAPGFPMDYNKGPKNTGSKPGPLYVVNPNVAYMVGQCPACDKPNTIGWTTDGGKSWVNGLQALTGYGETVLAIADTKNGWWITTDNTEPSVMYTTSDGGKTWTKKHTFDRAG